MTEMFPIDVGATICVDDEARDFRITNIWIDEDGVPQITITHGTHNEKITYDDIREKFLKGEVERTNTGHEAWQWRRQ